MWFYNAMNEAEPILSVQAAKEWPQKGYDMCAEKLGISIS